MDRILGLDFGSKTVGVAVSDQLGLLAHGVEIIRRKQENKLRQTYQRIEELCKEYDIKLIVIGLPKHMNDDIGDRALLSIEFGENLKRRTGLEVIMWDERMTTVSADRVMNDLKIKGEDRKNYVDAIAAEFILQGYLDSLRIKQEME